MVLIFLERLITMSHNVCVHSGPSAFSFMHRSPNLQRTQYDNIRDTPDFFSKEMIITKKALNENQLKYTYQKQLISELDFKHKEWSKFVGS